jgi:hypothetical protein
MHRDDPQGQVGYCMPKYASASQVTYSIEPCTSVMTVDDINQKTADCNYLFNKMFCVQNYSRLIHLAVHPLLYSIKPVVLELNAHSDMQKTRISMGVT